MDGMLQGERGWYFVVLEDLGNSLIMVYEYF